MSAQWGHAWRKLYRYPSRQWLNLPASARGLGDELIRVVEDDGRVFVGRDATTGVMRAVEAHASERRWIESALDRLVKDGFCRVEGEHLLVRNFVEAQAAISPSGERMRKLRAKTPAGDASNAEAIPANDRPPTEDVPASYRGRTGGDADNAPSTPNDSSAGVTVASPIEENRREEKREEGSDESPPAEPDGLPLETASKPKTKRVKTVRHADPPPFPYLEALAALAPAGSRFLVPIEGELDRGVIIAVRSRVRQFPDLATWQAVGELIAVGDVPFPPDLDASWVASSRFCNAVTAARSLHDRRAAIAAEKARAVAAYEEQQSQPWSPSPVHARRMATLLSLKGTS